MSFSALFYLLSVVLAYQLGAYEALHPGERAKAMLTLWQWFNRLARGKA